MICAPCRPDMTVAMAHPPATNNARIGWRWLVRHCFHTNIARSANRRLQRHDPKKLVGPKRYIRFPSPAAKHFDSSRDRQPRAENCLGFRVR
jgi:hypothetical protein